MSGADFQEYWLSLAPFLPFAFPALWLVYSVLGPFTVYTDATARKNPLFVKLPMRSANGNNPASQRVHEVGGWRFDALIAAIAGAIAGGITDSPIVAGVVTFGTMALMTGSGLTDIAEHGAEILDAERNGISDSAAAWQEQMGFSSYREAELHRMSTDLSNRRTKADAIAALDKVAWLSRIIRWAAR